MKSRTGAWNPSSHQGTRTTRSTIIPSVSCPGLLGSAFQGFFCTQVGWLWTCVLGAGETKYCVNRGMSPTWGCDECRTCGTFGPYFVNDPPPNHPIYGSKPLVYGWNNASVQSFWSDIFARPGGVTSYAATNRSAAWSQPSTGIVPTFSIRWNIRATNSTNWLPFSVCFARNQISSRVRYTCFTVNYGAGGRLTSLRSNGRVQRRISEQESPNKNLRRLILATVATRRRAAWAIDLFLGGSLICSIFLHFYSVVLHLYSVLLQFTLFHSTFTLFHSIILCFTPRLLCFTPSYSVSLHVYSVSLHYTHIPFHFSVECDGEIQVLHRERPGRDGSARGVVRTHAIHRHHFLTFCKIHHDVIVNLPLWQLYLLQGRPWEICDTRFIIFNTEFIVFNEEFIMLITIIPPHRNLIAGDISDFIALLVFSKGISIRINCNFTSSLTQPRARLSPPPTYRSQCVFIFVFSFLTFILCFLIEDRWFPVHCLHKKRFFLTMGLR